MRLEALGFARVYDYVAGKKDWLANGLPAEGERSGQPRAGDVARTDPPTCDPGTPVDTLDNRQDVQTWGLCVVVDDSGTVHGLVTTDGVATGPADARAEEVMELGPTTIRPNSGLESILERLDENDWPYVLVTTSLGRLLGVLFREDVRSQVDSG